MRPLLDQLLHEQLLEREFSRQLRSRRVVKPVDAVHVEIDERLYTNFSSNNYLGLTHHSRMISAMNDSATRYGAGAGASGLISGFMPCHESAEKAIAGWKDTASAVICPSGHQANLAAIQTFAALNKSGGGVRFLIDKLVHASLVDAVRTSEAPWRVFRHQSMDKLQRLLNEADPAQLQIVVTESIFSMDGDAADLSALAQLKQQHAFALLLDEAHGSGVYGTAGAGLAQERGFSKLADVTVVTFSKAAGCAGGAVCGGRAFCDALINLGRAYIFSTSVPPSAAAAIETAISLMRDEPWRQQRVRELARRVRTRLALHDIQLSDGDSPIIPIIMGNESAAMAKAQELADQGLLVYPIRPPTVAPGTSRLRVTLSCMHTDDEVELLIKAIGKTP